MGIFNRIPKLPPVENYPGYEETELAFSNAVSLVLRVMKIGHEEEDDWLKKAWVELDDFIKKNNKKLPEDDFAFLIETKELLWDNFRTYLLDEGKNGIWDRETISNIFRIFSETFAVFPEKYRVNGTQYYGPVKLMIVTVGLAFDEDKQILVQPIIEFVLTLWLHYCRIVGLKENELDASKDS